MLAVEKSLAVGAVLVNSISPISGKTKGDKYFSVYKNLSYAIDRVKAYNLRPKSSVFTELRLQMNKAIRIIKISLNIQLLILGMTACSMTATAAHNLSPEGLFKLSLEELLQVVLTPSRGLTTIEESPSPITVITADQIKQQGLKSLRDVLDRVPGV